MQIEGGVWCGFESRKLLHIFHLLVYDWVDRRCIYVILKFITGVCKTVVRFLIQRILKKNEYNALVEIVNENVLSEIKWNYNKNKKIFDHLEAYLNALQENNITNKTIRFYEVKNELFKENYKEIAKYNFDSKSEIINFYDLLSLIGTTDSFQVSKLEAKKEGYLNSIKFAKSLC